MLEYSQAKKGFFYEIKTARKQYKDSEGKFEPRLKMLLFTF